MGTFPHVILSLLRLFSLTRNNPPLIKGKGGRHFLMIGKQKGYCGCTPIKWCFLTLLMQLVYGRSSLLLQIWVYGDSLKNFLVAVAVPNVRALTELAHSRGITAATPEEVRNFYVLPHIHTH